MEDGSSANSKEEPATAPAACDGRRCRVAAPESCAPSRRSSKSDGRRSSQSEGRRSSLSTWTSDAAVAMQAAVQKSRRMSGERRRSSTTPVVPEDPSIFTSGFTSVLPGNTERELNFRTSA